MNNLLRTLTENQHRSSHDLKLLLNTVKDIRAFDNKATDPFYESLEGLIYDLRTVTLDNHDAEAFLKPVSKSDVPDYYDVIPNPMDLQTMLKKVKAKQYKSKREFKDDLDLMWANCFTYNATEDHPLRQCALRLKKKADRLLMNITDRKDRVDPPIPGDPPSATGRPVARPKINGITHDRNRDHTFTKQYQRSPTLSGSGSSSSTKHSSSGRSVIGAWSSSTADSRSRKETLFPDSMALIRTPEGMAAFRDLDQGVAQLLDTEDFQTGKPGPSTLAHAHNIVGRLRQYTLPPEPDDEDIYVDHFDPDVKMESLSDTGEKRKPNASYSRQSKRPRLTPPDSGDEMDLRQPLPNSEGLTELWWDAVQSDALFANGLPCLPSIASFPPPPSPRPTRKMIPTTSSQPPSTSFRKRLRARPSSEQEQPRTLLALMNSNIKTLKRVRRTHTKFVALGFGGGDDGVGTGAAAGAGPAEREDVPEPESELPEEATDERPWLARLRGVGGKGKVRGGIEIGERAAGSCLGWMNRKVLDHAGFQGASGAALDVLTGVTSEFLFNVGRTLRFLCDKYAQTMTSEEIILHALFESGITRIQDLDRYITDDVLRQGIRLTELEKKLENAYREATSTDILDDDAFFNSDQEEEDGLAMGTFADALGEDFLGLRELGIAAELGLSSLSVPKRLLKGKKDVPGGVKAKPAEALLPYPLPPPFLPVTSKNVEDQIGLLHQYYRDRLVTLAGTALVPPGAPVPSIPGAPGAQSMPNLTMPGLPPLPPPPSLRFPSLSLVPGVPHIPISAPGGLPSLPPQIPIIPPSAAAAQPPQPVVSLPEDSPSPAQTKVGPIGQVIKPSATASTVKKKGKGKDPDAGAGSGGGGASVPLTTLYSGTMMDGAVGSEDVGMGNGGGTAGVGGSRGGGASPKKKAKAVDFPPVIAASA
ncbi:hypothetical protein J3A83DRAFT_4208682 [Scleroderma citrinum]